MRKNFNSLEDAITALEGWRAAGFSDLGGLRPGGLFKVIIEPFDSGALGGSQ